MNWEDLPETAGRISALATAIHDTAESLDRLNGILLKTHEMMGECVGTLESSKESIDSVKERLSDLEGACEAISEAREAVFATAHDQFDVAEQTAETVIANMSELKEKLREDLHRLIEESARRPLAETREEFFQSVDSAVEHMTGYMTEYLNEQFTTNVRQGFGDLLDRSKAEFSESIESLRAELIGTAESSERQRELAAQVREILMTAIRPLLNEMDRFISLAGSVGVPVG